MLIRSKRYRRFDGTAVGALIAASAVTMSSQLALGAIVDSGPVNIPVPQTTAGIYINFITGMTGTTAASVPGYDFNPYNAAAATQLGIYWGPAANRGGAVDTAAGSNHILTLPNGTVVDASLPFTAAITATTPNLTAGVTSKFIGIKFYNEGTTAIDYGWMQLTTTAANGFPAVIERYVYDDSGGAITIPASDDIFFDGFEGLE